MKETVERVSIGGAPTIRFVFDDNVCTAELECVKLHAQTIGDPETDSDASCSLRVTSDGEIDGCLADIIVRKREPDDNLTDAMLAVGSALMWSAWRYVEARRGSTHLDRMRRSLDLIAKYASIDGSHHKAWVIDQVVRELVGDQYDSFVAEAKAGEDGPDTYEWDVGIAP